MGIIGFNKKGIEDKIYAYIFIFFVGGGGGVAIWLLFFPRGS